MCKIFFIDYCIYYWIAHSKTFQNIPKRYLSFQNLPETFQNLPETFQIIPKNRSKLFQNLPKLFQNVPKHSKILFDKINNPICNILLSIFLFFNI